MIPSKVWATVNSFEIDVDGYHPKPKGWNILINVGIVQLLFVYEKYDNSWQLMKTTVDWLPATCIKCGVGSFPRVHELKGYIF